MNNESRANPGRRITTGGIVIMLGGGQAALPTTSTPMIKQVASQQDVIERNDIQRER
jgi:hypothetical protein